MKCELKSTSVQKAFENQGSRIGLKLATLGFTREQRNMKHHIVCLYSNIRTNLEFLIQNQCKDAIKQKDKLISNHT